VQTNEIILTLGLAGLLLGLGCYFIVRQRQALRNLKGDVVLSVEDRRYLEKQAKRRIVNSILMFVFAGFLLGWVFLAPTLPAVEEGQAAAEKKPLDEDQKARVRLATYYWILALVVLFAILILACADFLATARFGLRHQRQLQGERRAVIEEEIERLRQFRRERNGQS